jgi:HEAT repeat protein
MESSGSHWDTFAMEDAQADALSQQLGDPDLATIEAAVEEMLQSEDRRFVEPLITLLDAKDTDGLQVADHVVWVVVEHARGGSNLAADVIRGMSDNETWLGELP